MRVILDLKSLDDFKTGFQYHHKVQGFIYSLLRNTEFENLHDKKGYKFFCFSNIFSANTQSKNYKLIISSPSDKFIHQLSYQLEKIIENQIPVEIGSLFELIDFTKIGPMNETFPLSLITGSPILIRIPIEKFKDYSTDTAPYNSVYWRSSHPIHLFVEAVESNLKKKYMEFRGLQVSDRLLEKFKFKKQVSTKIEVGNNLVPVIGTMWEFTFSTSVTREFQLFCMDCGFGERNSFGFGFMNPIGRKRINHSINS